MCILWLPLLYALLLPLLRTETTSNAAKAAVRLLLMLLLLVPQVLLGTVLSRRKQTESRRCLADLLRAAGTAAS